MVKSPAQILDDERMKDLLARNLDRYMRKAGITQTVLAQRSGIGKSTLNTYFVRKSFPNAAKLDALAQALNVAVADLAPEVDREEIRTLAREQGEAEAEDGPVFSMAPIAGRPDVVRLVIRADMPAAAARRILALALAEGGEETAVA